MKGWAQTIVWMAIKINQKKEVKFKCQENVKKIFSKRNGLAEVTENDSNDTLVLDNDAHRVNLHS